MKRSKGLLSWNCILQQIGNLFQEQPIKNTIKLRSHVHQKINCCIFSLIVLHKENIYALETSPDVFICEPQQSKSQKHEAAGTLMLGSMRQQLMGLLSFPDESRCFFPFYFAKYFTFFMLFQFRFSLLCYKCVSAGLSLPFFSCSLPQK